LINFVEGAISEFASATDKFFDGGVGGDISVDVVVGSKA
jgi:hypothetical protein